MTLSAAGLIDWLIRRRTRVLLIAGFLLCVAGARTSLTYLNLKSELEELLPETAPAVSALDTLRNRLRGLRHLGIVVDTGGAQNVAAANRFVDDLAGRLEQYPEHLVAEVRTGIRAEREFVETYMLQLMELEDVRRLRESIEARRDWEVTRALDMNLLDEEEDPPPSIPIDELRKKYQQQHQGARNFPGDRLVSSDGKTVVLLVQAGHDSSGQDSDMELLARVRADIAALGFPAKYAPGMRVGFAADVATRVEELQGLQTDLSFSGALVLALVVLVIVWYFQGWRALVALGVPLMLGTTCAFAVAALPPFNIRYLNSNTAFLGSIVIGNGINSGIILLARFQEERRQRAQLSEALSVAVQQTWRPTLAAALAASAAYGSLVFTDFRGFNQFGWIGGLGMLLCWGATMLVMPPLLSLIGRPMAKPPRGNLRAESREAGRLTRVLLGKPAVVALVTALATLMGVLGLAQRSDDWIEYDLSKLRRRDSWVDGERYWGARMDETLGRYLTPSVVMANTPEQAKRVKERLEVLAAQGKAGDLIARVQTASSLLPETRFAAVEEAKKIKEALTPKLKSKLKEPERELVERALSDASLIPLQAEQIPKTLVAGLVERSGRIDRSVLIYPKLGGGTWDAERIQAFADDVRAQVKDEHPDIQTAGTVLLSSDIARALQKDGPRATSLSLLAVLGICLVAFSTRKRREGRAALTTKSLAFSLAAIGSLFLGVLLMLGGLAWTGARLNFSNFVALPITFGIAADYSINMLKRYQAEGRLELRRVFRGTGGAVALCSITTIIGFGSLLVAQNQALFSFGVFAVVGEFTCLLTAVVVLPAIIMLWERKKAARNIRGHLSGDQGS